MFPVTVMSGVAGNAPPFRATKTFTESSASAPFEGLVEVLDICNVAVTPVYPPTDVEARSRAAVSLFTCHERAPPRIRWPTGTSPEPVTVEMFPKPALIAQTGVAGDVSKS